MPLTVWGGLTLEQYRRFFAEEIRAVANLESAALVNAFASVPREQFLGAPPWLFCSGPSLKRPCYRPTQDVRDIYHDVFVALKPEKHLNNGQPSYIARMIAALNLSAGKRVLHIGAGSGYYSAIMVEVVRSEGAVVAIEVDRDLAIQATANLIGYNQVTVVNKDGADFDPGPCDAILVNAAVTHPNPSWLDCLSDGGVLVLPLSVGKSVSSNDALVVEITRRHDQFSAGLLQLMTMYSSTSLRDPARQSLLNQSLESRAIFRLASVQTQAHRPTENCIVHTPGFCLNADTL